MHNSDVAGSYQLGVPHLQLGELIGGGGFAQVFHGYDSLLRRHLAVKILRPVGGVGLREMFEAEAAAHGALSRHPNIVTIHQVGWTVDGSRPFLVMDHVSGGSLGDYVAAYGAVAWEHAVAWMIPVCAAVQHAHDQGILHRDIKPDNILLEPPGEPVLSDFGIACLRDDTSPLPAMSIGHAAPEALRGDRRGTASGVYSLGSTLYHLLAGSLPFRADAFARFRSVDVPPAPLPSDRVPAWVDDVVRRAMDPDPALRTSSARELGRALEAGASQVTLSHPTVLARPSGRGSTVADPRPPHPSAVPEAERTGPGLVAAAPGPGVEVASPTAGTTRPPAAADHPVTASNTPVVVVQAPPRSISTMMVAAVLAAVLAVAATVAWTRYQRPATGVESAGSGAPVTEPAGPATSTEATVDPTTSGSPVETTSTTAGSDTTGETAGRPAGGGDDNSSGGSDPKVDDPPAPIVRVSVPDVTGKSVADATKVLDGDLTVDPATTAAASCTVASGLVVKTDPPAGEQVDKETTVHLTVSSGPASKVVPAVTGKTEAVAKAALQEAGFPTVTVKNTFFEAGDSRIGTVTAQSVAGGESASTCNAVTITVGRRSIGLLPKPGPEIANPEQKATP